MSLRIGKSREGDNIIAYLCINGVVTHTIPFKESDWNEFAHAMPKGVVVPSTQMGTAPSRGVGMSMEGAKAEMPTATTPDIAPIGSAETVKDPVADYLAGQRSEDEGS